MKALGKIFKFFGIALLDFIVLFLHFWSVLAFHYCAFPNNVYLSYVLIGIYIIGVLFVLVRGRFKLRAFLLTLIGFLAVALWFNSIKIDKDAVYPEQFTLSYAEFDEDNVTVHNVRNNDYRTREDFDVHYDTRTYDLNKIQTLDLYVNYWGNPNIAHTFLSFGFSDGRYLAVSVEIRPKLGQEYNEISAAFKQFGLIYVWADERDVARLRTNYRKEDVYLYRVFLSPEKVRRLFVGMLKTTNDMKEEPVFYNTFFHSCTNTLGTEANRAGVINIPIWDRRLLTGNVDRRMYKKGLLDTSVPFEALRKAANINAAGQAADKSSRFSQKIRAHLRK